jgi:hypothetical protein
MDYSNYPFYIWGSHTSVTRTLNLTTCPRLSSYRESHPTHTSCSNVIVAKARYLWFSDVINLITALKKCLIAGILFSADVCRKKKRHYKPQRVILCVLVNDAVVFSRSHHRFQL